MMDSVTVTAHAKINPALDVTGRRPDGYHTVRIILQQISLHDVVTLTKRQQPGVGLKILQAAGSSIAQTIPADATNLAFRAAVLLMEKCGIREGVDIVLEKRIPAAAGLAGGSADAAAVLKGMNALFELGLTEESLRAFGLSLGADVPYCIMGGCALAEGIGEILSPLPPMPPCRILLVKPPEGISTGSVYRALDKADAPDHPDIDAAIDACRAEDLSALCAVMGNVLEEVTFQMLPRLSLIRSSLLAAGAAGAMMSGSGSTIFGLFAAGTAGAGSAKEALSHLQAAYPDCTVILTEPVRNFSHSLHQTIWE